MLVLQRFFVRRFITNRQRRQQRRTPLVLPFSAACLPHTPAHSLSHTPTCTLRGPRWQPLLRLRRARPSASSSLSSTPSSTRSPRIK